MRYAARMPFMSLNPGLEEDSSGVFVSQGVTGESAPQVLPPRGKGHSPLSPGGGAGVGAQH